MTEPQPAAPSTRPVRALAPRSLIIWVAGLLAFALSELIGVLVYTSAPTSVSGGLAPLFFGAVGILVWLVLAIVALVIAIIALGRPAKPKWPAVVVLALTVALPIAGAIAVALGAVHFTFQI